MSAPRSQLSPSGTAQDLVHYPIADLLWTRDDDWMTESQVILNCQGGISTALVFIHGFSGSALATWEEFPAAIRALPAAAHTDAFFVDYPSTTQSVQVCGDELRAFISDLLRSPIPRIVNPSLPKGAPQRPQTDRYSKIVILAHSMGAVVVRRALLDLDRMGMSKEEHESIKLLLFAPAHRGSKLPQLVASGLGLDWLPGSGLVGRLIAIHFRSLSDLEEGSTALELLLEDSRKARERRQHKGEGDADLRAYVLHARDDKVVVQGRFDEDMNGRPIAHRHHRNVCKPEGAYRRPIEEFEAHL